MGKDFEYYTGKSEAVEKGGPGSGHWGHKGRKGKRGGSAPSKGKSLFKKGVVREGTFTSRQLDMISEVTKELPQEHLDSIKSLKQAEESVPWRGDTDHRGNVTLGTKESGLSWNKGILRHEIGHAVMEKYLTEEQRNKFGEVFGRLAREAGYKHPIEATLDSEKLRKPAKGYPTVYSMSDMGELFAEGYGLYVAAPKYLKNQSPHLYSYMEENVFEGREYG